LLNYFEHFGLITDTNGRVLEKAFYSFGFRQIEGETKLYNNHHLKILTGSTVISLFHTDLNIKLSENSEIIFNSNDLLEAEINGNATIETSSLYNGNFAIRVNKKNHLEVRPGINRIQISKAGIDKVQVNILKGEAKFIETIVDSGKGI